MLHGEPERGVLTAACNRVPYYPGNAAECFDCGFNTRAVTAFAPAGDRFKAGLYI